MADGDLAPPAAPILEAMHLFTVDDYHRMGEAGIFAGAGRVELIEGVIASLSPVGPRHFAVVLRVSRLLAKAVGEQATLSIQGPVRMAPRSEPEPDVAVLKPRADDYEHGLPGPRDVLLLVEVSDATLARDRDVKVPLYARHGIVEYWLLDLNAREALVHRQPQPDEGRFLVVERKKADAVLELAALPGARIPLAGVFSATAAD